MIQLILIIVHFTLNIYSPRTVNSTLYIGVTTDLSSRLWEHQSEQQKKSFSARYNLYKLVYVEPFPTLVEAIRREKYLKGKSRAFKEALINKANPDWNDLSNSFIDGRFLTDEGRPPQRGDTPQEPSLWSGYGITITRQSISQHYLDNCTRRRISVSIGPAK